MRTEPYRLEHRLGGRLQTPHDLVGVAALGEPLHRGEATERGQLEVDERDFGAVLVDRDEHLVQRPGLDDREVALACEKVPDARTEDSQRVGDENASPVHASLRAAAFSLGSYGRAW